MRTILLPIGMAAALLAGPAVATARNLIQNGSFEQGFQGWTVTPASNGSWITIFTNPGAGHTGNSFVQFLAFGSDFDHLSQAVPTSAGAGYTLDFWLRSFQDTFQVSWNGVTVFTHGPDPQPNPWTEFTLPLSASTASTTLEFRGRGSFFLDDVSVTQAPAPWGLFVLGMSPLVRRRASRSR
jgi:MYXO-CTERM domain-containing protein